MIHSHWGAALFFSLVTSIVFAVTTKDSDEERVRYGIWVFAVFVMVSIGLSFVMYLGHR